MIYQNIIFTIFTFKTRYMGFRHMFHHTYWGIRIHIPDHIHFHKYRRHNSKDMNSPKYLLRIQQTQLLVTYMFSFQRLPPIIIFCPCNTILLKIIYLVSKILSDKNVHLSSKSPTKRDILLT